MKSLKYIVICLTLTYLCHSQNSSFNNSKIHVIPGTYTVAAYADTVYGRYLEITLNDTLLGVFNVKLTDVTTNNNQLVKDTTYFASSIGYNNMNIPLLAAYKINSHVIRVSLGNYSLLTRHRIRLKVVGLKPEDTLFVETDF